MRIQVVHWFFARVPCAARLRKLLAQPSLFYVFKLRIKACFVSLIEDFNTSLIRSKGKFYVFKQKIQEETRARTNAQPFLRF